MFVNAVNLPGQTVESAYATTFGDPVLGFAPIPSFSDRLEVR